MRSMPGTVDHKCPECRARRRAGGPRAVDVFIIGGISFEVPAKPYCDCYQQAIGFSKRDDGVWVRPCCRRPAKQAYEKRLADSRKET